MRAHPKSILQAVTQRFAAGSVLLLTLAFLPLVGSAQDQTVPVPELETLQKEYASLVQTVNGPYLAAVAETDKKYIARLESAQEAAQQAGKLDEALAIAVEKKAVSSGSGVPAEDDAKTPGVLRKMRATYRAEIAKLDLARARNLKPMRDDYAKELDALVTSLTKDGKLEEALIVRRFRQSLPASPVSAPQVADDGKADSKTATSGVVDFKDGLDRVRNSQTAKPLARIIDRKLTLSGIYSAPDGLLISKKASLTIAPGTIIIMAAGTQIRAQGNIKICGAPKQWVYLCGEKEGPSFWKGIYVERVDGVSYSTVSVRGLVISDAERGIDIDIGTPPAREFDIRESVFVGNGRGLQINREGTGLGHLSKGTIVDCLFDSNADVGTRMFGCPDNGPRAKFCSFVGNTVAISAHFTGAFFPDAVLAEKCLFRMNKTGVTEEGKGGALTKCVFEGNDIDARTIQESATLNGDGNYWGEETTDRLDQSGGSDSGGKISSGVRMSKWLPKPPVGKVGADFFPP
jgi:hypothetical protein